MTNPKYQQGQKFKIDFGSSLGHVNGIGEIVSVKPFGDTFLYKMRSDDKMVNGHSFQEEILEEQELIEQ